MQHAFAVSSTLVGVEAVPVTIEVDLGGGLPSFTLVGLAEAAVRESRVRVQAALENSGFPFPVARLTVNMAPAHIKKDGTGFDLPMALAILSAAGCLPDGALDGVLCLGELSLSGEVRPVRGALAAAEAARAIGRTAVLVAPENGAEAALVDGVQAFGMRTLADAVAFLKGGARPAPIAPEVAPRSITEGDLRDVKGQGLARRALEIAAAGAHNILLIGGPGAGKTMLARRMPGILPAMTRDEALEVTRIHSVAGLNLGVGLATSRPFRAPHHSTTPPGLVGGGAAIPRPGEVTIAHNGVLFLDELPEFPRLTLETLREPLESGEVVLSRASGSIRYPARCLLVASMNPCPCGHRNDPRRRCRCQPGDVARYQARISGPLLDRIDLHVVVPPVDLSALESAQPGEASVVVAARVARARQRQLTRQGAPNAQIPVSVRDVVAALCPEGRGLLSRAVERLALSARGHDRMLRVARTIADLDESAGIRPPHVREALTWRDAPDEAAAEVRHPGGAAAGGPLGRGRSTALPPVT